MKLIHYTNTQFDLIPMKYEQTKLNWKSKPLGLWVSVDGEDDWKSWCEAEGFRLERLVVSYEVMLKTDANMLYLKTPEEILEIKKEYPWINPRWDDEEGRKICGSYEIDWDKMAERYQGIIISPYQWSCRMHNDSCWYYGWDCASGCIWDLNCIQEFKLIEDLQNANIE